jgi:aryl-alcohol dehydrogenase-like predicted oxidoreductase
MRQVELGTTSVRTSAIGLPVGPLVHGVEARRPLRERAELLREAAAAGITYMDVADVDGEGRGEALLGEAFAGSDAVQVATTVGYDLYSPDGSTGLVERPLDWTPQFVRFALQRSLERLRREAVDVYALHHPRPETLRSDELFETLRALRDDGRIRAIGVRLPPGGGWDEVAIAALRERGVDVVRVIHEPDHGSPSRALIEAAAETGASLVVRRSAGEPSTLPADPPAAVVLPDVLDAGQLAAAVAAGA